MPAWICATCGNHYPDTEVPPAACIICQDERQWVPPGGQRWTTLKELEAAGTRSVVREVEPGLLGIGAKPQVAIGQRALLLRTPEGNLLWDLPGFIDGQALQAVADAGGLRYVTASHPHFYGAMVEWSRAFGAEILLPDADAAWFTRPEPGLPVRTWSGKLEVLPGVTLIQCGGHFAGSAVVHWAGGAEGAGALFSGDTICVTPGEDRVTFIASAPNRLPQAERSVRGVVEAVRPYDYERIYGGWWSPTLWRDAKRIVERSAERYIQWLRGEVTGEVRPR